MQTEKMDALKAQKARDMSDTSRTLRFYPWGLPPSIEESPSFCETCPLFALELFCFWRVA
ncbi:MAG: hypothetical protein PVS2B2_03910 [Candidatus Acidiferrum sp.]